MIDIKKYTNNKEKIELIQEIYDYLLSGTYLLLKCGACYLHVDPYGVESVTVDDGEKELDFKTIDTFFLQFIIDGKPLIERIDELEYDI